MIENVLKTSLLEKLALAAKRKGGVETREIAPKIHVAVFRLKNWGEGIFRPKGMETFKREEKTFDNEVFVFFFPETVVLE